jgi:hypothetical protein
MREEQKLIAQHVLDVLYNENLLPFRLFAREIKSIGAAEYIVYFYDSRLHSVDVSCRQGRSFEDEFRAALLGRAGRISGPLSPKNS